MKGPDFENIGRVLAVDVRTRWVSHAAFDSSARLLDFGASRFRSAHVAQEHFLFIVELLRPTIVVFRGMSPSVRRCRPKARKVSGMMRRTCYRLSIQVALLRSDVVRNCFKLRGAKTKQQIASLLADEFSTLEWKLPPPRRNYDHEHWNMPIFDAVALGVAYFSYSTTGGNRKIGE